MKLIIITHGRFGTELKASCEMIMGSQPQIITVDFLESDSLESLSLKIKSNLNNEDRFILLTDIKGGTPFNVSYLLTEDYPNIELGFGANLPLVLSIASQINSNKLSISQFLEDELIGVIKE